MPVIPIADLHDPRLALFSQLTETQLRSRRDREQGILIAESEKVIGHALDAGCEPVALLLSERHLRGRAEPLLERCGDVPVYTAEEPVLERLTGYHFTRGFLAAFRRPAPRTAAEACIGARRVAVLDGITDAANVGAAFRSAAALGCGAVLLSPTCCDPLTRRALRVSMGTVFQVPWARLEGGWPEEGLGLLRALGFRCAALALDDRSVSIDDPVLHREPRLALLLGTEGDGLDPRTIALCDYTVKIPMAHGVDSLNVAAASAVAFWELCRS